MTLKNLSKLYYLKRQIALDKARLAELEAKLQPGGAGLDGLPRSSSVRDSTGELVPRIVDLKNRIEMRLRKYEEEEIVIEKYIDSIDDYCIRLILFYRFVELKTWNSVAMSIGGGNTEDSVKKACYRFLRKSEHSHEVAGTKTETHTV